MSAPIKKRAQKIVDERSSDDEDDSNSDDGIDNQKSHEQGLAIQVDFEGRNPQDPDYHGIKTLLQQLFLKAHIDLGSLTDLIITQNYVGSVIKQSNDDQSSDDEEDDDINSVFGITTVVNLSNRQNLPCIQQLKDLLRELAREHATDAVKNMIENILENQSVSLGLLINERFINIPAEISVPLLENLVSEMKRASSKNMPFEFTYFILICKLYKTMEKSSSKKVKHRKHKGMNTEPNILWSNPEEEIFAEAATVNFEFSVEQDSDSGLSGTWTESDEEMIPYRRVLLFESSKLPMIIKNIKSHVSPPTNIDYQNS